LSFDSCAIVSTTRPWCIGGLPLVFADVGANIGLFAATAAALDPMVKVFAFEPNPLSYQLLEANNA
jgi:predicted RNA methylase